MKSYSSPRAGTFKTIQMARIVVLLRILVEKVMNPMPIREMSWSKIMIIVFSENFLLQ